MRARRLASVLLLMTMVACGGPSRTTGVTTAPTASASGGATAASGDGGAPASTRALDAEAYCAYARALEGRLSARVAQAKSAPVSRKEAARITAELRALGADLAVERGTTEAEVDAFGAANKAVADRCGRPRAMVLVAIESLESGRARGSVSFREDAQAALNEAKRDRKPALLVVCAEWTAACTELYERAFGADAPPSLGGFVRAWADVTDEESDAARKLMARYKVVGLPTLLVFDRDGREVARELGFVNAEKLRVLLEKAR
jgi:hypothetical protein